MHIIKDLSTDQDRFVYEILITTEMVWPVSSDRWKAP